MFQEQADWLRQFDEKDQLEILSASIRNNWQGLHPPKHSANGHQSGIAFSFRDRDRLRSALIEQKNEMFRNGKKGTPEYEQICQRLNGLKKV